MPYGANQARCNNCGKTWIVGDCIPSFCSEKCEAEWKWRWKRLQESSKLAQAVDLLKRCHKAGHRDGWQDGETNDEVFAAVNDFLSDHLGPDWGEKEE